jgi:putative oxidoreductase
MDFVMDIVWLAGRILISLLFIVSGVSHLRHLDYTAQAAASSGMPAPKLLALLASLFALLGGLGVALGFRVEIGAMLLLLFLVPITLTVHPFWKYSNPEESANHKAHFMKNVALIGATLFILYTGPGPFSLS